ncbi:hypothetical protein OAL44_00650 [Planctomycetaceae bacterium]|nr:hypothetical protein [Planctomycetaceae bacterium]
MNHKNETDTEHVPTPRHLSKKSRDIWKYILSEYDLEIHYREILLTALEARDRAESARKFLDENAVTYQDRFDQPKQRPEVKVELDNRTSFWRGLRELGLDESEVEDGRLPRSRGRK